MANGSEFMIKSVLLISLLLGSLAPPAHAETGPANAKKPTPAQKLDPILPAQPPQANTGNKPSVVGVPASEFRPKPPPLKIKEPPSPK